jgi:hypothetical protein
MKFTLAVISLAVFSGGCAFKETSPQTQTPEPLSIRASWREGDPKAQLERTDKKHLHLTADQIFWTWDLPLLLPANTPDAIDLRLDLNAPQEMIKGLTIEDCVIEWRKNSESPTPSTEETFKPLRHAPSLETGQISDNPGSSFVKIRIEELGSSLPKKEQSQLELRISFRDAAGNWIARYQGLVRTPPSYLGFQQKTVKDYEAEHGVLDPSNKRIPTPAGPLDLLGVVEVKNGSASLVDVDFMNQMTGASLSTRFETVEYIDKGCSYEISHLDSEPSYTTAVYLVELSNLAPESQFIGMNPKTVSTRTLHLQAGRTALLGVYGVGPYLSDLLDHGRAQSTLSRERVKGVCNWQCPNGARTESYWWTTPGNFSNSHYVECRLCEGGDLNACRSCHQNEPDNLGVPERFCYRWVQSREELYVDIGVKTYPITLLITPALNPFNLRWPGTSEARPKLWPAGAVRLFN